MIRRFSDLFLWRPTCPQCGKRDWCEFEGLCFHCCLAIVRKSNGLAAPGEWTGMRVTVMQLANGNYQATIGPCQILRTENDETIRVSASELSCTGLTKASALGQLRSMYEALIVGPGFALKGD